MTTRAQLPTKLVAETKLYTFDFTSELPEGETIVSAEVTITTYSGTDAAPDDLVSGVATISGAQVTQLLTGGTLGVLYYAECSVVLSDDQELVQAGYVAVVQPVP